MPPAKKKPVPKTDDADLSFVYKGATYRISFEDLTLGETEMIEEAFDRPIGDVDFRRMKAIRWLMFIVISRKREISMDELAELKDSDIEFADPTVPGSE